FATWAGWMLNYEDPFILITDDGEVDGLTRKLMRIGLDKVAGYISTIRDLGLPLETEDVIDYDEIKSYLGNPDVQIVDVRGNAEFRQGHIDGAEHVFIGTLPDNLDKID